ncbi:hypothetical protein [Jongsikchunia kroppenstedtii]|uniref:hypothetical protein n=1 Tax=Jongsikchunia kroppenstedtii TaxID=1121721 RepID=UPI0003755162|nr:hypothetical protein [Jongsikchunia kroppenstedtii]
MTDPLENASMPPESEIPTPANSPIDQPERRSIRIGLAFLGALALVISGWVLGGVDFDHQNTSTLTWVIIAVAATAGLTLIASGWRKKR